MKTGVMVLVHSGPGLGITFVLVSRFDSIRGLGFAVPGHSAGSSGVKHPPHFHLGLSTSRTRLHVSLTSRSRLA